MINAEVTVIIINWKLPEKTVECLASLAQQETPHHTIVVDNGSGDHSVPRIRRAFPDVTMIPLPENIGFGAACNLAIKRALENPACNYILLLNNDAIIHPQALTELVAAAAGHPEAGILGPKIYYRHQRQIFWYAGARCRQGVLAAADTGRGEKDYGQFDARREVDFVFGAAMLIRRDVFARIGFFDERFFLYLEDMDFCLRARQTDFALHFVPQAHVWHHGSASTKNNGAFRKYHYARSTVLFLKKHASPLYWPPIIGFWLLVLIRAVAGELWRGNTAVIRSYLSGFLHGLSTLHRT
jgi:hypothetical protein